MLMGNIGWILCKPQFQGSYETKRLIEEFEKNKVITVEKISDE